LNCITDVCELRPSERPNTSTWLSKCPWALRKSSTLTDVINGVPRGGVLLCLIHDDEEHQLVVEIDEQELRLEQFGKLLTTYAGWGMRIEFVPEDEVHRAQSTRCGNRSQKNEDGD
jgi:hypothetical protein